MATRVKSQNAREALRSSDPVLARLIESVEPVDLAAWRSSWSMDPFRALARSVVGQQIAGRAAEAIVGRLQTLIGDRDPAAAIASATDSELRAVGLSAAKATSLRDLAARTLDRRLELDRIDQLSDDEARTQLTAVREIGPWTADIFLLAQLGRPDILPAGDLGVRRAVQLAYGLDSMPSEREVRAWQVVAPERDLPDQRQPWHDRCLQAERVHGATTAQAVQRAK